MSYLEEVNERKHRGILTPGDVEYLQEAEEPDRHTRYRIRERAIAAILDLGFLYSAMSLDDMAQLSKGVLDEDTEALTNTETYYRAIGLLVASEIYGARRLSGRPVTAEIEETLTAAIEYIELAVPKVPDVEVDVELNSTQPDIDELLERIGEGDATDYELLYAMRVASESEFESAFEEGGY